MKVCSHCGVYPGQYHSPGCPILKPMENKSTFWCCGIKISQDNHCSICGEGYADDEKEVRRLTKGLVTDSRAREVWKTRKGGLNHPPKQSNTEETVENQEVNTEPNSAEVAVLSERSGRRGFV